MEIRKRGELGNLKLPTKIYSGPTEKEKVIALGAQLAQEKLANIQKRVAIINSLGAELAMMKLEVMEMKGGAS